MSAYMRTADSPIRTFPSDWGDQSAIVGASKGESREHLASQESIDGGLFILSGAPLFWLRGITTLFAGSNELALSAF